MTDAFDDDDLFAPREPAPAPPAPELPPRRIRRPAFIGPRWPVASLACRCGAEDEVKEPCPDVLPCWNCKGGATMIRRAPRFLPPRLGGRSL